MPIDPKLRKQSDIEKKLGRFLEAQTAVFEGSRILNEWARESLAGSNDQDSVATLQRQDRGDGVEFKGALLHRLFARGHECILSVAEIPEIPYIP